MGLPWGKRGRLSFRRGREKTDGIAIAYQEREYWERKRGRRAFVFLTIERKSGKLNS